MLSEKAFTGLPDDYYHEHAAHLALEMGSAAEWIIRDPREPDDLQLVYVTPTGHGDELQTACSCLAGTVDRCCPHALAVLRKVRSDEQILIELFKRRAGPRTATV